MAEDNPEQVKALTKNPLGSSGKVVAANVERLRNLQNLTFAALSERLDQLNRPIPPLGLRKIVAQTRRVDADDLVGLAAALNVSPVTLLMPPSDAPDSVVSGTAVGELEAEELLAWLRGDAPLPQQWGVAPRAWTLPQWFTDSQDKLVKDVVNWQSKILTLEEQMRELQARGDH